MTFFYFLLFLLAQFTALIWARVFRPIWICRRCKSRPSFQPRCQTMETSGEKCNQHRKLMKLLGWFNLPIQFCTVMLHGPSLERRHDPKRYHLPLTPSDPFVSLSPFLPLSQHSSFWRMEYVCWLGDDMLDSDPVYSLVHILNCAISRARRAIMCSDKFWAMSTARLWNLM